MYTDLTAPSGQQTKVSVGFQPSANGVYIDTNSWSYGGVALLDDGGVNRGYVWFDLYDTSSSADWTAEDLRIQYRQPDGAFETVGTFSLGVYYTCEFLLDYDAKTTTVSVSAGASLPVSRIYSNDSNNLTPTRVTLTGSSYSAEWWGGGGAAHVDNISVSTVPEPTGMALLLFGGLILLGYSSRRVRRLD